MQEIKEEEKDFPRVDAARHKGSVRLYEVQDTDVWIQSDITVDDYLEETDATFSGSGSR